MDPVSIGITILSLAADLLKDNATMDAIFKSDKLTEEQKTQIHAMRQSLEAEWDSLLPHA